MPSPRPKPGAWRLGAVLWALTLAGPARAWVPSLSAAQVSQARAEGDAMSVKEGGYVLGGYLLQTYNDDIILRPGSPEIDGVVISTPFERVRYEAYLSHLEAKPMTGEQAAALARGLGGKLTFRVYSHSPYPVEEEEEQWQRAYRTDRVTFDANRAKSYLDFYKPATLTVAGRSYTASPTLDGPYRDNFTLPSGEAESRNLGVVFYTFDARTLPASGAFTLSFRDSRGKAYTLKGDLGQHR